MNQKELDKEIFAKMKSKTWDVMRPIYLKLHKSILSLSRQMNGKLYTIYIQYTDADKVVAVVFYKNSALDVGLSLPRGVKNKKLKNANYMRYPGITRSYKITKMSDINRDFIKLLKISRENAS